jgi:hypothetical protein
MVWDLLHTKGNLVVGWPVEPARFVNSESAPGHKYLAAIFPQPGQVLDDSFLVRPELGFESDGRSKFSNIKCGISSFLWSNCQHEDISVKCQ